MYSHTFPHLSERFFKGGTWCAMRRGAALLAFPHHGALRIKWPLPAGFFAGLGPSAGGGGAQPPDAGRGTARRARAWHDGAGEGGQGERRGQPRAVLQVCARVLSQADCGGDSPLGG